MLLKKKQKLEEDSYAGLLQSQENQKNSGETKKKENI